MGNAEAIDGIIGYLNQREFAAATADIYPDRPFYGVGQQIHADYAGLRLGTLFQPLVAARGGQLVSVAHEALLAVHTANGAAPLGQALTPQSVFALPHDNREIIALDRLARTLHALNFLLQESATDLHLNVDPHHLVAVTAEHGRVFEQILRQSGLDPTAIVLEVDEYRIRDRARLRIAIAGWQSRGYRIAIDNFGRGHQQLQRVLELGPDSIKFDRSLLHAAAKSVSQRDSLARLVARSRTAGVHTVATGLQSAEHVASAQQAGFDALQGFFLGRPDVACRPEPIDNTRRRYA